jgi:hypothetical protein
MSVHAERSSARAARKAQALARLVDGSNDPLPPGWTIALLPFLGMALLLLAGRGWGGMVLVLIAITGGVVALVRAASWR